MPKHVSCKRALLHYQPGRLHPHADCDWTATADGVDHVVQALEEHTLSAHKIDVRTLAPGVREQVLAAVGDASENFEEE